MHFAEIKQRVLQSRLFKDSFWAVFGNGMGYALLLLAGIIIARLLGKDLYGVYGVVKTTMLYIAGFTTFGLGTTSTKYIAQYIKKNPEHIKSIVRVGLQITLSFSGLVAILLFIFAKPLSIFLDEPGLVNAFRILGLIVICRSMTTTESGILAGFGDFKSLARNNLIAGLYMLIASAILTYKFGLCGAYASLLTSQMLNMLLNYLTICKQLKRQQQQEKKNYLIELLSFSFPIALQESSYTICNWVGIMILTKLSTLGEVGQFTAAGQWNAIIMFIPGLLQNVILSHLSSASEDIEKHIHTTNMMLKVNLVCTIIMFSIVFLLAEWISSFYGPTFTGLQRLICIYTLITIPECCVNVLKAEFISQGKNWLMFSLRVTRDLILLLSAYLLIKSNGGENGALHYVMASMLATCLYFLMISYFYIANYRKQRHLI